MFTFSPELLLVLNYDFTVRRNSRGFLAAGFAKYLAGTSFFDLVAPEDVETARATLHSIVQTKEQVPLATRIQAPGRSKRTVHWLLWTSQDGERIFAVGRDVTDAERSKTDRALHQRLEAVGRLASGVAHEINTPLQFLTDNLSFITDALDEMAPLFEHVREAKPELAAQVDLTYLEGELPRALASMNEGLTRVRELVRSLKQMAPEQTQDLTLMKGDVIPIIKAVLQARPRRAGLEMSVDLAPLPELELHAPSLTRVFSAVLDNAIKAIERRHGAQGGHLTVRAETTATQALISFTDDGAGIAHADQPRMFEPFFSRRDVGEGSGGRTLTIARTLIERHHGEIDFTSEPGVGTTFTIRLPLPIDQSLWD